MHYLFAEFKATSIQQISKRFLFAEKRAPAVTQATDPTSRLEVTLFWQTQFNRFARWRLKFTNRLANWANTRKRGHTKANAMRMYSSCATFLYPNLLILYFLLGCVCELNWIEQTILNKNKKKRRIGNNRVHGYLELILILMPRRCNQWRKYVCTWTAHTPWRHQL